MGQFWGSLEAKWDQIEATDHLIFNVHHLFDLNLVKIFFVGYRGEKASQVPRLLLLLSLESSTSQLTFYKCLLVDIEEKLIESKTKYAYQDIIIHKFKSIKSIV